MADGSLKFDTLLDVSGIKSGVEKAKSSFSKLTSFAKTGIQATTAAIGGLSTALTAGIGLGVKYDASMQTYISNFETMLGSSEKAAKHVAELKEFANKTPFEMTDLASASKTLLSFGTDVTNVMPDLKMLGDVSLGNKDKFNSLALVFGQVSSQGKMMGQDLLQCINAGFNPLQVISEHTGESMASLKDRMSKGEIGIDDFTQALEWATSEGGKFCGGMEKASKTFDGMASTMKDEAMSLVGEVVEPITDSMANDLFPEIISGLDKMSAAFQKDGIDGLVEELGNQFADLSIQAAEALPSVIDTSVNVVDSFCNGLSNNSDKIADAGIGIVKSTVKGMGSITKSLANLGASAASAFIKEMFGSEISKSFDKFVDNSKKNLNELKKSTVDLYNSAKKVVGNGIKDLSKIGSITLPMLTKSVEFLSKNFETLLPLVTAGYVAFKSYVIMTSIAKAMNAYQKAMEGATVAQKLLNAAADANPYILLASAVAGVVAAFTIFSLERPQSESEKLKIAQDNLKQSFNDVGSAAGEFHSKVEGATGILDSLTSSAVVSSEKQQELADSMTNVQDQITQIFETASDQRRSLTQSEIDTLEELMNKEQEIADRQVAYEQAYQEAVQQKAEVVANTHYNSIQEYEEYASNVLKSANDTKDKVVQTAEDQYTQEIINLKQKLDTCDGYTQEQYEEDLAAATQHHDDVISAAQQECSDTYATLADGYYNNSTVIQDYNTKMEEYLQKREQLTNEYNERAKQLDDDMVRYKQEENASGYEGAYYQLQQLQVDHNNQMNELEEERSGFLDDNTKKQLGTWEEMASGAAEYGGECTNKVQVMSDDIQNILDGMPEDTRDKFERAWEAAEDETDNAHSSLISKAADIASGMMNKLKSVFDIHSPSRKMRKIFNYVMQGGELGLDDESDNMLSQVDNISDGIMSRFNVGLNYKDIVDRMKSAVSQQSANLSQNIITKILPVSTGKEQDDANNKPTQPIVVQVPLTIDGREFARAETPYISTELALSSGGER